LENKNPVYLPLLVKTPIDFSRKIFFILPLRNDSRPQALSCRERNRKGLTKWQMIGTKAK
jgi:hypothetical protein